MFSAAITPGGSGSTPALIGGLSSLSIPLGGATALSIQLLILDIFFFAFTEHLSFLKRTVSWCFLLFPLPAASCKSVSIMQHITCFLAVVLVGCSPLGAVSASAALNRLCSRTCEACLHAKLVFAGEIYVRHACSSCVPRILSAWLQPGLRNRSAT